MSPCPETSKHPCFDRQAKASCARVHLPVAPACNVQCNFCNRSFDCVNESRPGVTSAVLNPQQAVDYLSQVQHAEPRLTVAGIAGPGDPLANPIQTLETIRLARERFPGLLFCLSTNGLDLPQYVQHLAELGLSHVTITVNAVDPEVGSRIYKWAQADNVLYTGLEAGRLILSRQIQALSRLKELGLTVKVNSIVLPGINDQHILDIAQVLGGLGVDLMNCLPVQPTANTALAHLPQPDTAQISELRSKAGEFVPQMTHCRRCRADAVGLLDQDRSRSWARTLTACAQDTQSTEEPRPFVAVATREGMLVNKHLGEARYLQIWGQKNAQAELVEERRTPPAGSGSKRWQELARILADCRTVLTAAAGQRPREILGQAGIEVAECSGLIPDVVQAVYRDSLSAFKVQPGSLGAAGCAGGGEGCG
ncbi:MAG: radical SAM protein [Desulfohalobiaceae bacterium]